MWEDKKPRIAKEILSKKSNAGNITIPDLKLYYRVIAIKTAWYWHTNRHEDQWNTIEVPHTNLHSCSHLIFWERSTKHMLEKKIASSTNVAGETGYPSVEHWNYTSLSPYISINSKWIKDLKTRSETVKLL
jgi:hypothetical protein